MTAADAPVMVEWPTSQVAVVRLHRPATLNALNLELVEAFAGTLQSLSVDDRCRVVVLTGDGRGFCSGFDLNGYGDVDGITEDDSAEWLRWSRAMQEHIAGIVPALRSVRQPVIAAVNGAAVGGGLALALASDVRVAADSARFGVGFVRIGLSGCDVSVSWTLPKLVGVAMAHELMLTGRVIDAAEALRIGLVTHVVADTDLLACALGIAAEIAANAPLGVEMTKRGMWAALEAPSQAAAMELENRTQVLLLQSADYREGRTAMQEKRPPTYRGR
jgi:enoyl-CoA hydratase